MELILKHISKIYIFSLYIKTGGPRSLHQLGSILKNNGYDVYMLYQDNINATVPLFSEYNIPIANKVDDSIDNILILPEVLIGEAKNYKNIKIVIWWLSLYYFKRMDLKWHADILLKKSGLPHIALPLVYLGLLLQNSMLLNANKTYFELESSLRNYFHLYNCEYEKEYLLSIGIKEERMRYLCGPLSNEYIKINRDYCIKRKRNIVAINPSKVNKYILRKFIKSFSNEVEIVLIKNMSPEQVKKTLLEAKVYVDLGYFPGPERIPREAVILYCNILTSKIGAAKNKIDVPIFDQYKTIIKATNIKKISMKAEEMIKKYDKQIDDFDQYREKVLNQINRFENDVISVFSYRED